MHEASLYDRNCFLTLTYDDAHLPLNGSLVKRDFQLFMKRLRKRYGSKIRFYMCGEYGESPGDGKSFGRPHYHALLFNHSFSDQRFFSRRQSGTLFTSDSLSELWPFGFSVIGEVTFESAAYVSRYVMKKVTGEKAAAHYGDRVPEFTTMSRGCKRLGTGGIGKGWFEQFKSDVYPRDGVVVRGHIARPPRFYDDLLGREDRALLEKLKIQRELNGFRYVDDVLPDGRVVKVSDRDSARLRVREVCKLADISALRRPLEEI